MHHLWPKSSENDPQRISFWSFLVGMWDSWKSMFYYSKTSIFKVLGGPVSRILRYIFHGIHFFTFYLIFLRFLAENVLKWVPGGGPKILKFHQKSSKWGALEVILRAFWSQVVHFRGRKVLLEKWWKNESKKRPQSEKTDLPFTLGRGCVALKETPEATGQRPDPRSQTP